MSRKYRYCFRHTIKPGLAPLAWPGPKVGLASFLASILASTQILAWPQKLAWPQIWPLNFFLASFFFQNSNLFRDVLIMISMIDWLFVWLFIRLWIFSWLIFFSICYWSAFSWWEMTIDICITDWCLISVLVSIHILHSLINYPD